LVVKTKPNYIENSCYGPILGDLSSRPFFIRSGLNRGT